jgi:hypothetical protein
MATKQGQHSIIDHTISFQYASIIALSIPLAASLINSESENWQQGAGMRIFSRFML